MFCRNCGKELAGAPEICSNCGAKPTAGTSFCLGCGAPTMPLTEVCTNCGVQVAKAIKKRTWKPIAAGVLCIIAGFIAVIFGIAFAPLIVFGIIAIVGGIYALRRRIWGLALAGSICALIGFGILGILISLLVGFSDAPDVLPFNPTISDILAIISSDWYLIVSIVSFTIFGILGIPAIVFVVLGKREFECRARPMAGTSFCPGCGAPTTPLTKICTNCGAQVAEAIKERTWKPTAAGILSIIAGAINGIWCISFAALVVFVGMEDAFFGVAWGVFVVSSIILGIIAIVGGIYALLRKIWGLALAGSICALVGTAGIFGILVTISSDWHLIGFIVGFVILGILAIIFVIMGKREFK
jgi:hypothetical protein